MKKLIGLLSIISVFFLSSCVKDYTCMCDLAAGGEQAFFVRGSKRKAIKECEKISTTDQTVRHRNCVLIDD